MKKSYLNETTTLTFYKEYNKLCKVNVGISSVETRRMWDVILFSFINRNINIILFERMLRLDRLLFINILLGFNRVQYRNDKRNRNNIIFSSVQFLSE